jgi:hypothetical protein
MEKLIEDFDVKERLISWSTLAYEAGLEDICKHTIQHTIGRLDYHKCVACRKS